MSASPVFPVGNIFAPPWMCVSPSVAGYEDTELDLDLPAVTVAANSIQQASPTNGQQLPLDSDFDFLVREIQITPQIVSAGTTWQPSDLRVRLRDADGRLVTSDFVQAQNLCGPLPLIWALKKSGVVSFDFENVSANPITVQPILKGWKRKACADRPAIASAYRPLWSQYSRVAAPAEAADFEYYFTFTRGAGDYLKIPLQTDNDADFLFRGIQGDWNCLNNDVATVGSVGVALYDPTGTRLTVLGLVNPWNSGNVGQFRESILSSGGGQYAPLSREILVPRGGVIEVDLSFGQSSTLRLSLRGVKVYTDACPRAQGQPAPKWTGARGLLP